MVASSRVRTGVQRLGLHSAVDRICAIYRLLERKKLLKQLIPDPHHGIAELSETVL
jgi:hypothetical protein